MATLFQISALHLRRCLCPAPPSHCLLTDNFTLSLSGTTQPVSQLCFSLSSPALCPSHPTFIFWVLSIATEAPTSRQKRPPGARVHLRVREVLLKPSPRCAHHLSSSSPLWLPPYLNPLGTPLLPSPGCLAAICGVVGTGSSVLLLVGRLPTPRKGSRGILVLTLGPK